MELSAVNSQSSSRQLTIAHLNNDCLEKVFSYLSLTDLTNVADSNVVLAISAQSLFTHQNLSKEFRFNCYDEHSLSDDIFLLVLQHFGKYIDKLRVHLSTDKKRNGIIFDAIVANCRNTLSELVLLNCSEGLRLNQEFPCLKKLQLWDGLFGIHSSMTQINEWFPNLMSIKFYDISKLWENSFNVEHFPNLQHFGFFTFPGQQHTEDSLSKLARFLHLNPQLKCLELDELHEFGKNKLRNTFNKLAPSQLPNIERLVVVSPYPFPCAPIQFNNLKELSLSVYRDETDVFNQLPRTLECFELRMITISASAINYILSCTKLKKLKLTTSTMESLRTEEIAKELHALTEIHIKFNHSTELIDSQTLAGMEHFFLQSKQMKAITLEFELNSFDESKSVYEKQVDFARKFTEMINDTTKMVWRLSHEIHQNEDDHRLRALFCFPYLRLSFKKRYSH